MEESLLLTTTIWRRFLIGEGFNVHAADMPIPRMVGLLRDDRSGWLQGNQ
jgi:hypothetical protein